MIKIEFSIIVTILFAIKIYKNSVHCLPIVDEFSYNF